MSASSDAILTQILTQLQVLQVSQQTLQAKVNSAETWRQCNVMLTARRPFRSIL